MIRVFSFGGGVQSTAVLVLAAQGRLPYQTFLFANVGTDTEHPKTLAYVNEIARSYAQRHGLALIELRKIRRGGEVDTIYQRLTRPGSRSIGIPVRMSNGAPGNRACTMDFKVAVCDRWLKQHGARIEGATVGIGISLDEFQRMRSDSGVPWKTLEYPLITLRVDRATCLKIIQEAGLPIPPKSSCWFCPYHSAKAWQAMREQEPDLFQKAVELEQLVNDRRALLGKDSVWFHSKLKPLEKATTDHVQPSLFDETSPCDSGYCWT